MSENNHDPRSLAMTRETHPERFSENSPAAEAHEMQPTRHEGEPPAIENTATEEAAEEWAARVEKKVEELQAHNDELIRTVENERNEKELYRRVATLAESNELMLHRKLSPFVEGEASRLRTRNEALEKALKENTRNKEPEEARRE